MADDAATDTTIVSSDHADTCVPTAQQESVADAVAHASPSAVDAAATVTSVRTSLLPLSFVSKQ